MDNSDSPLELWTSSASAWVASQGEDGDKSRREILDPALDRLLADVQGLRILDVGCGEGRYARKLAAQGALVTGLDPIPAFLRIASELGREQYVLGSGEQIPFKDGSFDVVLSYLSLVDIPDDAAASREMVRVLKRGGRLVVVTVSNMASPTAEWVKDAQGKKLYRTVDDYMDCRPMRLAWKGIDIVNYHRPLSRTIGQFLEAGTVLTTFLEPLPSPNSPEYADEYRVPTFQILEFGKV